MTCKRFFLAVFLAAAIISPPAFAAVNVQCPGDANGDAVPDEFINGNPNPEFNPNVRCKHITAGDGFVSMGDGRPIFIFGFSDVTGLQPDSVMPAGNLAANFPAPTIFVDEGNDFYLTVTNVGMAMRPDLFDAHTVHWHGFPQASAVFDGVPDSSISVNMGSSLTYFYKTPDPGTYMYHCHFEATEHMQMGMLGNLYVRPKQNALPDGTGLSGFIHHTGFKYAYNDGDGSTYYDIEYPVQIGSFDPAFHDASETIQPLPFALMKDLYPMLNGRGYPDTAIAGPLPPMAENNGKQSQNIDTVIQAEIGKKILLRISNLNVTRFYTLATTGLKMEVVGVNARHLRSSSGQNLYYKTSSVTVGGGESVDVIIDTADLTTGTYFLYTTNLQYLGNNEEDFGGMMTEIEIKPAI